MVDLRSSKAATLVSCLLYSLLIDPTTTSTNSLLVQRKGGLDIGFCYYRLLSHGQGNVFSIIGIDSDRAPKNIKQPTIFRSLNLQLRFVLYEKQGISLLMIDWFGLRNEVPTAALIAETSDWLSAGINHHMDGYSLFKIAPSNTLMISAVLRELLSPLLSKTKSAGRCCIGCEFPVLFAFCNLMHLSFSRRFPSSPNSLSLSFTLLLFLPLPLSVTLLSLASSL